MSCFTAVSFWTQLNKEISGENVKESKKLQAGGSVRSKGGRAANGRPGRTVYVGINTSCFVRYYDHWGWPNEHKGLKFKYALFFRA